MKSMKQILIAVGLASISLVAHAETPYGLMGYGALPCSYYSDAQAEVKGEFFTWAQGYMSGVNAVSVIIEKSLVFKNLRGRSVEEEKRLIGYWCGTHPASDFADAALQLYRALPTVDAQNLR